MTCTRCNDYGGNWLSGQPTPTRTWNRYQVGNSQQQLRERFGNDKLEMRRKAEVLLHTNNRNNWTKKERFAYYAKNPKQYVKRCTGPYKAISNPSSSSDVPGNMSLVYDISVPLSNWKTNLVQTNAGGKNVAQDRVDCSGTQSSNNLVSSD